MPFQYHKALSCKMPNHHLALNFPFLCIHSCPCWADLRVCTCLVLLWLLLWVRLVLELDYRIVGREGNPLLSLVVCYLFSMMHLVGRHRQGFIHLLLRHWTHMPVRSRCIRWEMLICSKVLWVDNRPLLRAWLLMHCDHIEVCPRMYGMRCHFTNMWNWSVRMHAYLLVMLANNTQPKI